jgi:hypothetical protein
LLPGADRTGTLAITDDDDGPEPRTLTPSAVSL